MAEPLKCGACGAELTNDALVAGACTYCGTALKLPPRPGKKKQARIISRAGDEVAIRVDEGGGVEIQHFEGMVWDPNHSEPSGQEILEQERAQAVAKENAIFKKVLLVLLVVGAIAAVLYGLTQWLR